MKNSQPPKNGKEKMRIQTEPDYVALKRFSFSLKKLKARYPDGAPSHVSANALCLAKEEFDKKYEQIVEKLRMLMGIDNS